MKKKRLILSLIMVAIVYVMLCGYTKYYDSSQNKVIDDADLFNTDEEITLGEKCIEVANDTKLDIVIVTSEDVSDDATAEFADNFFNDNAYGYDQGASGVLLLIDMNNRTIYMVTSGIAVQYFNDEDVDNVLSELESDMSSENYYDAAYTFTDEVASQVEYVNSKYSEEVNKWFESDYDSYDEYYDEYANQFNNSHKKGIFSNVLIDLVAALALSGIITLIMASGAKSKMTVSASTYVNHNKVKIHNKSDIYLRTSVTKTKVESSNGNSHGNGSTHKTSNGRSHGGGGKKF